MLIIMFKQILAFCALLILVQTSKLPKTWKVCKKDDSKHNDCMKEAVEKAIRDLADTGNPTFGVLPVDPLRFDALTIDQGQGPVSIKLDFSDLNITGFKNIKIDKINNDWKTMEIDGLIPKVNLTSNYKINGKILVLPISGDGTCELIFTNFKPVLKLKIKEVTKGGKKYYEASESEFKQSTEKVHVHFNNLFNGDKALGDNMNLFLNENSQEILAELAPAISKAFGTAFQNIANRIFIRTPVNEISP